MEQFIETKRFWKKTDGRLCYHGYQSFKADEVNAQTAHTIGVALAQELWGDRFEVVVATHCNTGHYHNHFVINSVSCVDGYKFYNSHEDYRPYARGVRPALREARLSVIDNPKGCGKHYAAWQAEQNGKPTIPAWCAPTSTAHPCQHHAKGSGRSCARWAMSCICIIKTGTAETAEHPTAGEGQQYPSVASARRVIAGGITQRILQNVRKQNLSPKRRKSRSSGTAFMEISKRLEDDRASRAVLPLLLRASYHRKASGIRQAGAFFFCARM